MQNSLPYVQILLWLIHVNLFQENMVTFVAFVS